VLTHGFMVDPEGRKMSKSVGNVLDVDRLLDDYGADVCRWFLGSISYENDVRTGEESFKIAGEAYRKVRNTLRFMLSNLSDFEAQRHIEADGVAHGGQSVALPDFPPESVDAWALGAFNEMSDAVRKAYSNYEFQRATTRLYNFCNETMSAVYLMAVKDRLYCDRADSARRRRTQTALWVLADGLCRLLAPVMPHTADEAWRELHGKDTDDPESVHQHRFYSGLKVRVHDAWPAFFDARERVLRAMERVRAGGDVENPLDFGVSMPDPEGRFGVFDPEDLADLCGVSRFELSAGGEVEIRDLREQPVCERSRKRHATVRERSDGGMLSDRDAEAAGVA
jgi:isoleucyl-tRNA synthetase